MKAEVIRIDINKWVNVQSGLNNLKTKVDDLDFSKLKTVPVDCSSVVSKEIVKNIKFNILNTEVIIWKRKFFIDLL